MKIKRLLTGILVLSIACIAMVIPTSAADELIFDEAEVVFEAEYAEYYTSTVNILNNDEHPDFDITKVAGKYVVIEATLLEVTEVNGKCPKPEEVTLMLTVNSNTAADWNAGTNGYPPFTGIGSTIKMSSQKINEKIALVPPEEGGDGYWAIPVQIGVNDGADARENGAQGDKFTAKLKLKAWISDTDVLAPIIDATADADTDKTSSNPTTGAPIGFIALPAVIALAGAVSTRKRK